MDKEKLIKQIMEECARDGEPVTEDEAAEMAEMEIKAKADCKRYERKEVSNKPAKRVVKLDADKISILSILNWCLLTPSAIDVDFNKEIENVSVINPQKEIQFDMGGDRYSVILTRHRKKK